MEKKTTRELLLEIKDGWMFYFPELITSETYQRIKKELEALKKAQEENQEKGE